DLAQLITRAEQLSGSPGSLLLQTDTFFPVPHGRLKVRDFRDGRGQLVFYDRPNSTGPKLSHFTVSPTDDPGGLVEGKDVAWRLMGQLGIEEKELVSGAYMDLLLAGGGGGGEPLCDEAAL
ncbi:hypothetical protein Chor_008097, partial [Crotalus horridus]